MVEMKVILDSYDGTLVRAGDDLFIVFAGRRIAKRGKRGSPQARTWVPLVPGVETIGGAETDGTVIAFDQAGPTPGRDRTRPRPRSR